MESSNESKPRVSFEFEVEKVIGVSSDGLYQIQWAPAWVSKFHLVGCEHLIREFHMQQATQEMKLEVEQDSNDEMDSMSPVIDEMNVLSKSKAGMVIGESRVSTCINKHPLAEQVLKPDPKHETEQEIIIDPPAIGASEINVAERCEPIIDRINKEFSLQLSGGSFVLADNLERVTCAAEQPCSASNNIGVAGISNSTISINETVIVPHRSTDNSTQYELLQSSDKEHTQNLVMPTRPCWKKAHSQCITKRRQAKDNHQSNSARLKVRDKTNLSIDSRRRQYSCSQCSFTSSKKSNMEAHNRTHTGEKPYSCEECGKSFSLKGNLVTHKLIHSGKKPHMCDKCGKLFTQKGNLNVHILTYHRKKSCDQHMQ